MTTPAPALENWLSAVSNSHQRLTAVVRGLNAEEIAGASYADEWSIAQVLSHLGSGAEIFTLVLRAGLQGGPPPGMGEFEPIWARWNAKTPADQATDALVADRAFIDQLGELSEQERQAWQASLFGTEQKLTDLLRFRLGEHAVHTWDVEVPGEPTATIAPDATELLVDTLDQLVSRTGQAPDDPLRVLVSTVEPDRRFLLVVGPALELRPADNVADDDGTTTLTLPGEALIRLVYGRLDAQHTPAVEGDADLGLLRRAFPGF